jgi:hypothetical protein
MLRETMTLDGYLHRMYSPKRLDRSARAREGLERDRTEIQAVLEEGDELWTWQESNEPTTCGGLAIRRDGVMVYVWIDWFSL